MNLTGHWKGKYYYGEGYSPALQGKSEPFEFHITDIDGSITGSCIDNVVQEIEGNQSYIIGSFINKQIQFKKRYKVHTCIDEKGNSSIEEKIQMDGVDYTGVLKRKLFSRKYYFKGSWAIHASYKDDWGTIHRHTCGGKWKMERVL